MRPFWLYLTAWLLPLSSVVWYESGYNVGFSALAFGFLIALPVMFMLFSFVMTVVFYRPLSATEAKILFSEGRSISFQWKCIALWYAVFVLETIASGGLPVFWGSGKLYGDFGLPVLHGFSNMLRAMLLAHFILFTLFQFKMPASMKVLSVLPCLVALFLEESRGAFIMTLCFGLGPILLFGKLRIRRVIAASFIAPLFIIVLSSFQYIRYADSLSEEIFRISDSITDNYQAYEILVMPVANYIATPALNAGLNIDQAELINFEPEESLKPLVPSLFRSMIWSMDGFKDDWGVLVNDAFNTSSFVTPLVRDFGLFGAFSVIGLFFFYSSYVFNRARSGCPVEIVRFPPLAMCIALSFFTTYLTSLVSILYVVSANMVANRLTKDISSSD